MAMFIFFILMVCTSSSLIANDKIQKDANILMTDKMVYFAKLKSIEALPNSK